MEVPKDLLYTKEHEWLHVEGSKAVIGITQFAQDQLGDVVFVELPQEDTALDENATFGVVESVKTVSDLYAPVGCKVVAVNKELEANPELVNQDPHGKGWMIEVELTDPDKLDGLLSAGDYETFIKENG